jgi:hypothetical protein
LGTPHLAFDLVSLSRERLFESEKEDSERDMSEGIFARHSKATRYPNGSLHRESVTRTEPRAFSACEL